MELMLVVYAIVISCLFLSSLSLAAACFAFIQVEALKRSTHQVTFLDPTKQAFETLTDDVKAKLTNL